MPFDFSSYDAVLLDLDGTIYHEDHVLPGAVALVDRLRRESRPFACLTNSTTSSPRLAQRLARMGIAVDPSRIYTAAADAAHHVLSRFPGRPAVFNLATEGMHELLNGQVAWTQTMHDPCDVVIAGALANVYATEDRQRIALALLRKGAALVGVCADRVYPSPRGIEFGSGAFCSLLGYAANVQPVFCGKPQPSFFRNLCGTLNVEPGRCLLIGDNLESDISGAKALGMATILTCTGITCRADLESVSPQLQPDFVVDDLTRL